MTIGELVILSLPGLASSGVILAMRGAIGSNRSLGERVGRLEQRADYEDGRRAGRAEALAERGEHVEK